MVRAVEAIARELGDQVVVMTDVCLCAYTDHGHCGVIADGRIDNTSNPDCSSSLTRRGA